MIPKKDKNTNIKPFQINFITSIFAYDLIIKIKLN